jgi:hypothetical protein
MLRNELFSIQLNRVRFQQKKISFRPLPDDCPCQKPALLKVCCWGPILNFQVSNKFSKNIRQLLISNEWKADRNKFGPNTIVVPNTVCWPNYFGKTLIPVCQFLNKNRTHLWMNNGNSIAGRYASCYSEESQIFPSVLHSVNKCCFYWLIQTSIHTSKFLCRTPQ